MSKPFYIPAGVSPAVPFACVGYFVRYAVEMPSDCLWIVPGTIDLEA